MNIGQPVQPPHSPYPTHAAYRFQERGEVRMNERHSPTTRTQMARIVRVDVNTGSIICRWITATDLGASEFLVQVTQPSTSQDGSHFMGGMPMVGDVAWIESVTQYRGELGHE